MIRLTFPSLSQKHPIPTTWLACEMRMTPRTGRDSMRIAQPTIGATRGPTPIRTASTQGNPVRSSVSSSSCLAAASVSLAVLMLMPMQAASGLVRRAAASLAAMHSSRLGSGYSGTPRMCGRSGSWHMTSAWRCPCLPPVPDATPVSSLGRNAHRGWRHPQSRSGPLAPPPRQLSSPAAVDRRCSQAAASGRRSRHGTNAQCRQRSSRPVDPWHRPETRGRAY